MGYASIRETASFHPPPCANEIRDHRRNIADLSISISISLEAASLYAHAEPIKSPLLSSRAALTIWHSGLLLSFSLYQESNDSMPTECSKTRSEANLIVLIETLSDEITDSREEIAWSLLGPSPFWRFTAALLRISAVMTASKSLLSNNVKSASLTELTNFSILTSLTIPSPSGPRAILTSFRVFSPSESNLS